MSDQKITLGISACLTGQKVRYDGTHKRDAYLMDVLGPYVKWHPVCPEAECGLPIPRPAMRLTGDPNEPKLVEINSGIDHTRRMNTWTAEKLEEIAAWNLCGFIFKSKSPSSGMTRIKVYQDTGAPSTRGIGLFARAIMDRFPMLPVEDEGRLHDGALRENFIQRVFVFHRWKVLKEDGITFPGLLNFHRDHKLLIMSHSPALLRQLGHLLGSASKQTVETVLTQYILTLMEGLKLKSTVNKNVNVLHHILGYFKKQISSDEKQEMLDIIQHYHMHQIPLIVPVTLLNHYVRKYDDAYLKTQVYLNPHPIELMLRNHV